jgi:hypothetical protein
MDKKLKKKSMCKWSKEELRKNFDEMYDIVGKPKYICGRCARATRLKGTVCKPEKLKKT